MHGCIGFFMLKLGFLIYSEIEISLCLLYMYYVLSGK